MAKRILIVDDELDLVRVTKDRLEKSGYEVTCAESGEEALDLLKRYTPNLILLDLLLLHMRGEQVCKQIKSNIKLKHIPIILFSASVSDMAKLAKEIGAEDYITKPYDAKELLEKIRNLI
jgi:DNA-binding response OmpR family regulator